jgi:hypothetical protein
LSKYPSGCCSEEQLLFERIRFPPLPRRSAVFRDGFAASRRTLLHRLPSLSPRGFPNDQVTPNLRRDFVLPNQLVVPEGASCQPPVHQTRRFDFQAIADFLRRVRHAVFVHCPEGLLPSTLLPASRRRPKTTLFCDHATGQHFRRSAGILGQTQYRASSIERFCDATPEGVAASPEGFAPATPTEAEVA